MFHLKITSRVLQMLSPIALGYIALGSACGILGQKAGLTPFEMFAMSIMAYAGSSQFIGIAMMIQGASLWSIALTILIVNLRYVLFSSTLVPYFIKEKLSFLSIYTHGITDETFAVNLNAFKTATSPPYTTREAYTLNVLGCVAWTSANTLGCFASEFMNIDLQLVSYILTAMFLGIWVNYLVNPYMIIVGLVSGFLATYLALILPYKLHIVIATLLVSGFACYLFPEPKEEEHNG